ncbi:unnamed protein product [Choristocarpus tenellus]
MPTPQLSVGVSDSREATIGSRADPGGNITQEVSSRLSCRESTRRIGSSELLSSVEGRSQGLATQSIEGDPRRWGGMGQRGAGLANGHGGGQQAKGGLQESIGRAWGVKQRPNPPRLTMTSKDLNRRMLQLAPGLVAAGFTEEMPPREADWTRKQMYQHEEGNSHSGKTNTASMQGQTHDIGWVQDRKAVLKTLRAVCRAGTSSRGRKSQKRPSPTYYEGRGDEDSVILVTRLGGDIGNGDGVVRGTSSVKARKRDGKEEIEAAGGGEWGSTAELWRCLWGESVFSKHVLLHVCTGPGIDGSAVAAVGGQAFPSLPVQTPGVVCVTDNALGGGEGDRGQQCRRDSVRGELEVDALLKVPKGHGEEDMEALGDRSSSGKSQSTGWSQACQRPLRHGYIVNRVVVAPLGSLRKTGSYCIAELRLPSEGGRQDCGGGQGTDNKRAGASASKEVQVVGERSSGGSGEGGAGGVRCRGGGWAVASLDFRELPSEGVMSSSVKKEGGCDGDAEVHSPL